MRAGWIPVLLALGLGLAGGLYYAWVVSPVEFVDTAPASLRRDFQDDYLALIAAAYEGTSNLERARLRLALIPEPDPPARLALLAQQRLAAGVPEQEARSLAQLAADLGQRPPMLPTGTSGAPASPSASPQPTRTPTSTRLPPPTRTASPTPGAAFELEERQPVCEPDVLEPLIMVEAFDAAGRPVPYLEVLVIWDTGQDHFFTGLKPELGLGYGDFAMTPGVTYSVKLAEAPQTVTGLTAGACELSDGTSYPGSWRLTFVQPGVTPEP
jgi:hypothetical protein